MFPHPVWPRKVNVFCTELGKCGDREEVCVVMWTSLQKAGPWFLGPDIINSELHTQFFFNDFVPNIVLGLGEMKMMGCISGCWESLKCEVYLGFNPSETLQSQRRSVPGQPFHTHISGLECPPSLPDLGMIIRAFTSFWIPFLAGIW